MRAVAYPAERHFPDNRLRHPLHALAIAMRRRTALPLRQRNRILAHCQAAEGMAGLRRLVATLPGGDRDEVLDILAEDALPAPSGWEPVGLLGRGGMGEAWLCGAADGGLAVLKVLRPELAAQAQAGERFRREIAATVALRHRNVVAALAADADAGWMLLEFVAGGDLRAAVQVAGPLAEADALAVAAQVADGLAAFAAAGMVHRDLKPSNLFVTPDGVIRIADLGLACSDSPERTRLTAAGRAVGSWSFMSPEQFRGEDGIDGRSDQFSLGVCLVALLAGRTPGGGQREGPMTIAAAERLIRPGPAMHRLLARLLQPDRAARFADVAQLQAAIAEAAAAVGGRGAVPSLELRSTAARLDSGADASSDASDQGTVLLPATATDAPPITADRIILGSVRSPVRWLLWAGWRLVLGKLRGGDVDLPLRNYPVEAHRDGLEELSRRHAEIRCDGGRAMVADLGSANGTRLDGQMLGREPRTLAAGEEGVLDLAGQVLLGIRAVDGGVVLRRLRNARSAGYALLTGRLTLGPAGADLPWPDAARTVPIEHRQGRWLLDGEPLRDGPLPGLPQAWARPLELADLDIAEPQ